MRLLTMLVILGGLAYGGYYLYQEGYFDSFLNSVDETTTRTVNFATDKALDDADTTINENEF